MTMTMSDEMHAGGIDYHSITELHIRRVLNRTTFREPGSRTSRHVLNGANFTRSTPPLKLFAKGILELSKQVGA